MAPAGFLRVLSSLSIPAAHQVAWCDSSNGGGGNEKRAEQESSESPKVGTFYNFPAEQKFNPKVPYPLWDRDWDGRAGSAADKAKSSSKRRSRKGVTRHVILVRHGQYDETHKEDSKRILTTLGREQAKFTGRRLAEIVKRGGHTGWLKAVHVSDLARAKEVS